MKWLENSAIFLAHIAYLAWILWVLQGGGELTSGELILHFIGMAIYGGLLIRLSAFIIKRRHLIDMRNKYVARR